MKPRLRLVISFAVSLLLLGLLIWGFIRLALAIWHRFAALDPNLAVGLLTTCTTLLVAALGLILGRLLERKKEIEAHFRDKKIAIYDEFMKEFFHVYYGDENKSNDLVEFLRNWQRQAMLWGGSSVLNSFIKWRTHLAQGVPDAQSLFLMEEFLRTLRQDIGLSNRGLERGLFIRMVLRNPDLFLAMAAANPKVTLQELSEKEKELGLEP